MWPQILRRHAVALLRPRIPLACRRAVSSLSSKMSDSALLASLDVLMYQGKVAQNIVNCQLSMGHEFELSVYNKLLRCYAEEGNTFWIDWVTREIKKKSSLDYGSYAALLYYHSRAEQWDKFSDVLDQMEKQGLELEKIFLHARLPDDEAVHVLKAIKSVQPDFKPHNYSVPDRLSSDVLGGVYSVNPSEHKQQWDYVDDDLQFLKNPEEMKKAVEEQLKIEYQGYMEMENVDTYMLTNDARPVKTLQILLGDWKRALTTAIEEAVNTSNQKDTISETRTVIVEAFLALIPAEDLASILMVEMVELLMQSNRGIPVYQLSMAIGHRLRERFQVIKQEKCKDKIFKMSEEYISRVTEHAQKDECFGDRHLWEDIRFQNGFVSFNVDDTPSWPSMVKVAVGGFLINLAVKVLQFQHRDKVLNAFYHCYEFQERKKIGVIKSNEMLSHLGRLTKGCKKTLRMPLFDCPMLVPPRPWSNHVDGGYLVAPSPILRALEDSEQSSVLSEKSERRHLLPILDSLNCVSSCAWKINNRMLDLLLYEFNRVADSELLDLPTLEEMPPVPTKDVAKAEQYKILAKRRDIMKVQREHNGLRATLMYRLSIANKVRDRPFWLPINMDFRGRCYPIPPHLHHLCGDSARSLMLFARGLPLGPKGLDWLKLHLLGLHGTMKKAPFSERLDYVNNHLIDRIFESADDPWKEGAFWRSGEHEFQTLACCMEIADAIRSGDPENFVSHLPIHQDGSCNGLQHYAALGRDQEGAAQVNLQPSYTAGDVYSGVADAVEVMRIEDARALGPDSVPAKLAGLVSRKVVKQTVMTFVYGVTFIGGRNQIARKLADQRELDSSLIFPAARYLCMAVFRALDQMFTNARQIQHWLVSCADRICLDGRTVQWVTPLGLPVIQPYERNVQKMIKTKLQSITVTERRDSLRKPDKMKQKNAFAPNFIHSLDACHMMLTSLHCRRAGITFAAVHDSYWTHAGTVDVMNKVIREQFVRLHSQPIVEELALSFQEDYGKPDVHWSREEFLNLPETGDFDLEHVKDSIHFFS